MKDGADEDPTGAVLVLVGSFATGEGVLLGVLARVGPLEGKEPAGISEGGAALGMPAPFPGTMVGELVVPKSTSDSPKSPKVLTRAP